MTFDDRVAALAPLGLTPRQTRFLTLVALHGGFCLRRQYGAFARLAYGKHVRDFLDALVTSDLARRVAYKRNRGFIYQVHAKRVYRAIGQEDNRNRRLVSPAIVARRLMLLDLVIATSDVEWLATEEDKVHFFTTRLGLATADLPQRSYEATSPGTPATIRAFVHKLPIYLAGEPLVPHFVCLADGVGEGGCETFLRDHARLLQRLAGWTLVVTGPAHASDFKSSQRAFDRFCGRAETWFPGFQPSDLPWYCRTRKAVEANTFDHLSVPDIARFRDIRRRLSSPLVEALYQQWLTSGDRALERSVSGSFSTRFPNARFEARPLPFRYDQFGDLPGL